MPAFIVRYFVDPKSSDAIAPESKDASLTLTISGSDIVRFFLCCTLLCLLAYFCLPMHGQTAAPAAMTTPAPGAVLPGSAATFSWTPGAGVTAYELTLGNTGVGSSNLYSSGSIAATSATVTGLPTSAATWGTMDAWLDCNAVAAGTTVTTKALGSCAMGNSTGGFSVKTNPLTPMAVAASQGGLGAAVYVSGTNYPAGTATHSLSFNHAYDLQYFDFNLPSAVNTKTLNMNGYITFAPPNTGATTDYYYDYIDAQDASGYDAFVLQLHSGLYKGCTYCVFLETNPGWVTTHSSTGIPLVPGTRYAFSIQANETTGVASLAIYNATTFAQVGSIITSTSQKGNRLNNIVVGNVEVGTASGHTSYFEDLMLDWSGHQSFPNVPHTLTLFATLSSEINGAWQSVNYTYTEALAAAQTTLSAVSCNSASVTGATSDACTITLSNAAPSAGTTVTLASNDSAVAVPASVTVAAGATSASFTATAAAVTATQTATLTATAGGVSHTTAVQLNAVAPALSVSATSVAFGNVNVNTASTQTVTLTSTGNVAVAVNSASVSGAGFTLSGATLPATLNPGQSLAFTVQFDPAAAGAVSGSIAISSNASAVTVSLSGTGISTLSAVSCANTSLTGAATDACTVSLSVAAPAGGMSIALASNNSSVTVPASVTVAAGATSAAFSATASSVSAVQTATLSASASGATQSFAIQLNAAVATLTVNAASINFGDVMVNSSATQPVTLTSTGNVAVTVNSASVSGTGFVLASSALPATLNPGQSMTLNVEFTPAASGAASGTLTIASGAASSGQTITNNALVNNTASVSLSGTGEASTPAAMTSPANGSALPGSSATFNWNAGSGVTAYQLMLGTTGPNSSDLYNSGSTTSTSAAVSGLPTGNAGWGTMDAWLQCASPAAGTTITTSVLSSCVIGNGNGGFTTKENPLTPMAVAASQGSLGASVTVAGTTYPASTATQSLSFDHAYDLEFFDFNLPSGVNSQVLNMNGYITFAPPNTGASTDYYYDYIDAQDPSGYDAFVIQLHSGLYKGCTYCVFLETNPGWVTTHSTNGIQLTPGKRYAFSVQANETTGVASLAIFDATTFVQIGSTITSPSATGNNISNIVVGNVEVGTASGYTSYFENLMLDWSNHQSFPNVPHPSTVYATLSSEINGAWQTANYTYTEGAPAAAALSAINCGSAAMSGAGSDNCTVTLNGAAASAITVNLSSNNAAVTVPASVTVAAGSSSATFAATASAVASAQTATLTATVGNVSESFALQLAAGSPALSVSASSVSFGDVLVNTASTQTVTLSSTGSVPVTINSASLSGAGFSVTGATFPMTLNPGTSLTLDLEFDPAATGAVAGELTIASNSTTGSAAIALSGTGESTAYQVNIAWNAPSSPNDAIAGYNVYRAPAGSSMYEMLNTSLDGTTSYTDSTVASGTTYDYYVESVDVNGLSSAPSTMLGVTVP